MLWEQTTTYTWIAQVIGTPAGLSQYFQQFLSPTFYSHSLEYDSSPKAKKKFEMKGHMSYRVQDICAKSTFYPFTF